MRILSVAIAASCLAVNAQKDLNAIEAKGYKFFDSVTGDYFPVKGVAYYPRPNAGILNENNLDFFTDEYRDIWERDIQHLKDIGVNAIRIYAVDPSKNHDSFMCALSSAGIYVIIGLAASCENCAITNDAAPLCYPPELKRRGQQIIKAFARYSNVLGFSAGNEVNHVVPMGKPEVNGHCQKKFLRDMRAFIKSCSSMRQVPVGVVLADTDREANALYYNCQDTDELENAEWYGLNTYINCDSTAQSFEDAAGFKQLQNSFQSYKYSIPVILTEYGCLNPSFPTIDGYEAQRTFLQSSWLYSSDLRDDFAGGFVFEYTTELANAQSGSPYPFTSYGPQNYGLGYFSPKNCDDIDVPCKFVKMPNFENLKKQYETVDVSGEPSKTEFTPSSSRVGRTKCPANFKTLASFSWPSDDTADSSCPNRVTWKCSGDNPPVEPDDDDPKTDINGEPSTATTIEGISIAILLIFVSSLSLLA